jgi:hypothetical protein
MGYYTRYELDILDIGEENLDLIRNAVVSEDYEMRASDLLDRQTDDLKWYQHDEEMRQFSKKFSTAVFTLSGFGEESGDVWVKYYHNGKLHDAETKIVHEQFDRKKLV